MSTRSHNIGGAEVLELSPRQKRALRLGPEAATAWAVAEIRVEGEVDSTRLSAALTAVVTAHPALRAALTAPPDQARVRVVAMESEGDLREHEPLGCDWTRFGRLEARLSTMSPKQHSLYLRVTRLFVDSGSFAVLACDLASAYAGRPLSGDDIEVDLLARWQRELMETQDGANACATAVRQGYHEAPASALPCERERRASSSDDQAARIECDARCMAALEAVAASAGCDVDSLILACFGTCLGWIGRRSDVVIGAVHEGARAAGLGQTVGLLAGVAPIRLPTADTTLLATAVHAARAARDEADATAEYPVDLQSVDDASTPWFRHGYESTSTMTPPPGAGTSFELVYANAPFEPFVTRLSARRCGTRLLGLELRFDPALLAAHEVAQLRCELETLLNALVEGRARISDPLGALRQLRPRPDVDFAPRQSALDVESVVQRAASHAERFPAHPAVVCAGETTSQGELWRLSGSISAALAAQAVSTDAVVGVLAAPSAQWLATLLGVMRAGAAYLMLDPSWPNARIHEALGRANACLCLTSAERTDLSLPAHCKRVLLDFSCCSPSPTPEAVPCTALAYVAIRPAVTGAMLALGVTHAQLSGYLMGMERRLSMPATSRFATLAKLSTETAHVAILLALWSGGALHLPDPAAVSRPEPWPHCFDRRPLDYLALGSSDLHRLLESDTTDLEVRTLIVDGEPLDWQDVLHACGGRFGQSRLLHHHRPTEACLGASAFECVADAPRRRSTTVPIGNALGDAPIYVLDDALRPVSCGTAGTLYIGGQSTGRGFVGLARTTAERFVPDPFSEPGGRMYRTGDRVVRWPGGELEFVKRGDGALTLQGQPIEPAEIEMILARSQQVIEAGVLVAEDGAASRLVACIVPTEHGSHETEHRLRSLLAQHLPTELVPDQFVFVQRLPRTPRGLLDRKALQQLVRSAELAPVGEAASLEARLGSIWQEFLNVTHVGPHDNFFHLGGDSIRAIQIIAKARANGILLQPRSLLQLETLRAVAQSATLMSSAAQRLAAQETGPLPLLPNQARLFEQSTAWRGSCSQALRIDVAGHVSLAALSAAAAAIVDHHSALRLRYHRGDSGWTQTLAPPGEVPRVHFEDLSHSDSTPAEWTERWRHSAQTEFDLEHGRMLQVGLWHLGPERSVVVLIAHALAVDAASWPIMLDDLWLAYQQTLAGEPIALPPHASTFSGWAHALTDMAESGACFDELEHWRKTVASPASPELSEDVRLPNTGLGHKREQRELRLSSSQTSQILSSAPQAYRGSPAELLLAALCHALTPWHQGSQIAIDVELAARPSLAGVGDGARVVGCLSPRTPVCFDVPHPWEPTRALRACKEGLNARPRGGLGFGVLRYLSGEGGSPPPLVGASSRAVSFRYLGALQMRRDARGVPDIEALDLHIPVDAVAEPRSVLEVTAYAIGECLQLHWSASAALTDRGLDAIVDRFEDAIANLLECCKRGTGALLGATDFPAAKFSEHDLQAVLEQLGES